MATNPNIELFRRTAPKKKVEIINNLTDAELLSISKDTVLRMVKECGSRRGTSRDKLMYIGRDRRRGNRWNSNLEAIELSKGKLFVWCYVQYGNTDTTRTVPYTEFFGYRDFRGSVEYSDRYGGKQTEYYTYYSSDKARVMKSICLEYLYRKYSDKLTA